LDVDMPGMDGLELCTRIHQMERHRKTPIVFVTQYDDINTRARSALSGGESLIAKPFMAFEIAVKALTLALRSRLQKDVTATYSTGAEDTQTQVGNATEAPAALLLHSLQQENRLPLEWNGRTAEKTFQRRDIITAKQARSLCSDQSVPGRLSPSILQKLSASADEP